MISERTLRKWRTEALQEIHTTKLANGTFEDFQKKTQTNQRILKMTQELLDQHLIRR